MFSGVFFTVQIKILSYFYFLFFLPNDLQQVPHGAVHSRIIFSKVELTQPTDLWHVDTDTLLQLLRYAMLSPFDLERL